MRKKAEKKIREAVRQLDSTRDHRLDRVRSGAGLHPRVFDKTILDMERVGTITLSTAGIEDLSSAEVSGLVRRGDTIYVTFRFTRAGMEAEETAAASPSEEGSSPGAAEVRPPTVETVVVILQNLLPGEWDEFSTKCNETEGKIPSDKIEEMIRAYLYRNP